MDLKKDVYAMERRPIPEEINEVYPAVMQALRDEGGDIYCDEWSAAAFYSLGMAHGIRRERQRRKKLMADLEAEGI